MFAVGDDGNGPRRGGEIVVCVELDKGTNECCFPDFGRSHEYNERRSIGAAAVRERNILLLLRAIEVALLVALSTANVGSRESTRIVTFDLGVTVLFLLLFFGSATGFAGLV